MLFLQLLQVTVGNRDRLDRTPTPQEWDSLYTQCRNHALSGVVYSGVSRLPKEQRPALPLLWQWDQESHLYEEINARQLKRCRQLISHIRHDGLDAVILKGITNLPNYPEEFRMRRAAGDIDVWIMAGRKTDKHHHGSIRQVVDYCLSVAPDQYICYIHIDFPVFTDVPVEAHLRPSFLCHPLRNRRLQHWFRSVQAEVSTSPMVPPVLFSLVHQLLHIYKHLFEEGIGLRQLMDFYFLLQRDMASTQPVTGSASFYNLLDQFGLSQFYLDLLWVLSQVFGLDASPLLPDTYDTRRGHFLLQEILTAGNFGQHDPRIHHDGGSLRHAWEKLKHNLRLWRYYPAEVFWEPLFRLYHYLWRLLRLWRWE